MAKKKSAAPTKVESIRHADKRTNIPTEELRDFVRDAEHAPKKMLYSRDPSLDPQLVWKGKDEQTPPTYVGGSLVVGGSLFVAEIRGLDVYDPTTGAIRNSSTDDIACWFIDTDYNGESFFVRHAYFTGADEPYEKLKRALRAEIDEAAWSSLYRTVSRPFEKPKSGKIAVKVISHFGDEVLKVFTLA